MRVLLDISYIGTNYCGWQAQDNGTAVQTVLENAIETGTGTHTRLTGSSRTDAGVHARLMRAHMEYAGSVPPDRLPFVINRYLPSDIKVTAARVIPDELHARFQAVCKKYTYRIDTAPHPNAMTLPYVWHYPHALDASIMDSAARLLLGTHDFSAFAAAGFQSKTTVRTISDVHIERLDTIVVFSIAGNGFLYNMVRIIAGTLAYIGQKKLDMLCIKRALTGHNRLELGPTAPPEGLELTGVYYDKCWNIPEITNIITEEHSNG